MPTGQLGSIIRASVYFTLARCSQANEHDHPDWNMERRDMRLENLTRWHVPRMQLWKYGYLTTHTYIFIYIFDALGIETQTIIMYRTGESRHSTELTMNKGISAPLKLCSFVST